MKLGRISPTRNSFTEKEGEEGGTGKKGVASGILENDVAQVFNLSTLMTFST